jgi:hypothetical protein
MMGRPRRKHANDHAFGVMHMILFFIFAFLCPLIYVNPSPGLLTTMGITMRTAIAKEKPTSRAITTTAATPKEWRSGRQSKSPRSVNLNSLLAEINLPVTNFDNDLEALHPLNSPTDNGLDNPCDLVPLTDTNNQVTQLTFPTGVDTQAIGFPAPVDNVSPQANKSPQDQTTPASRSVHINETTTLVDITTTTTGTSQHRQSILLSTNNSNPPTPKAAPEEVNPTSENRPREIYNRNQMLLQVFSNDGMKESCYHVTNFAGLYLVWPIVKFPMAQTGATKDERMSSFIKCVTALLGEMLYVDDMTMIAPINITNDDNESYIKSKADLPMNSTKLGKHIMISGGSWVFNKKEKGSNNVNAQFRLKL